MYKLVVLFAFLAYATAGLISPIASSWGHGLVGAPAVVSAPVVSAPIFSAPVVKQAVPVATSYANTVRIATPAVAVAAAPAPLAFAAHGPVLAGHGPVLAGHGW